MREVHFYRTEYGVCPVEEFLDALTGKQAQKVVWVLRLVEQLDPVPAQYFKKKTEKTPRQENDIASARRNDYLNRRATR